MKENHVANNDDTFVEGNVAYPNAKKLLRPQSIGGKWLIVAGLIVILAVCSAYFLVSRATDSIYFSQVRTSSQVEQNMAREIAYDLPQLKDYIAATDAQDVYNDLSERYELVQLGIDDVSSTGFDVFKLPEDVNVDEGAAALKNGIGSMDILSASKVLNGGWRITMDLTNYQDLRVRYTDFKSSSIEEAILSAIQSEGFDGEDCEITKEGVDESGNTFKSGTVQTEDETYFWRVSAVKFNDAYSIKGMPETAIYVGIRMTD